MNWGMMEILSPSTYSYLSSSSSPANWLITTAADNNHSTATPTRWTHEENKAFENALALYDNLDAPDRWEKVAAAIPGKTVKDVIRQYEELELDVSNIEAGFADIEVDDGGGGGGGVVDFYNGYGGGNSAGFTLEWVNGNGGGYGYKLQNGGKRGPPGSRGTDHERKKGIPWTEEEHKLFLMGLKKYGKGDWRNISRNFVVTRTPTQVASHAQKYFIRQLSGGKDKRRASIHDITTSTLDNETLTTTTTTSSSPPENHQHNSTAFLHHHRQQPMMMMAAPTTTGTAFPWNQQQQGNGGIVDFDSIMRGGGGNGYVSLPYGGGNYSNTNSNNNNPYAVKIEQEQEQEQQQHNGGGFNSMGDYNHQQMQIPLHHFTH